MQFMRGLLLLAAVVLGSTLAAAAKDGAGLDFDVPLPREGCLSLNLRNPAGDAPVSIGCVNPATGILAPRLEGQETVTSHGAVSDCPLNAGRCTDATAAFRAAIEAAQSRQANIAIPCGSYRLSGPIAITNAADTAFQTVRPSLRGAGARCVHLYFAPGDYDPITITGTNAQSPAALSYQVIDGFTVTKSDYQGRCIVMRGLAHVVARDLYATGCRHGFSMEDVQESQFFNLYGAFNALCGLHVRQVAFTASNALTFYGSSFSANGLCGADLHNPYVVTFHGGAIEQNGFNGGGGWGIRVFYPDARDVNGGISLNVEDMYVERNSGVADIWYVNQVPGGAIPSMIRLTGNNFNRAPNSIGRTVTVSAGSPAVVSFPNHGLVAGQPVGLTTDGTLPGDLRVGVTYYVAAKGLTSDSFQIAAEPEGAPIATRKGQSGTHTLVSRTLNVVRVSTANDNPVKIVSSSSYGLTTSGYVPSVTSPYFAVDDAAQPVHFCILGDRYNDYQEAPNFFASCDFAAVQMDMGAATTIRRRSNIKSVVRNGVGDYTFTFGFPSRPAPDGGVKPFLWSYASGTPGYMTITAYTQTSFRAQFFTYGNVAEDARNLSIVWVD